MINSSSHMFLYNQPCAIIITSTPLIHLDTHAIQYKTKNRKKFNEAGSLMMQRYRALFPNWNQHGRSYGMLDPSDTTRNRMKALNVQNLYREIDNTQYWQYMYKLSESYMKGKLICSDYKNEHS